MTEPPGRVAELAARRAEARSARDFATADELRGQIAELGWVVTDSPAGYDLEPTEVGQPGTGSPGTGATGPGAPGPGAPGPGRDYRVLADPSAIPAAAAADPQRRATVALLVEGWPDDLRECVTALLAHAPAGVVISALDVGNSGGAGDALHELAVAHPGRIEAWHVAASPGWSAGRNALLRADPAAVHVLMETSTILTGDAISPLLDALAADGVVATGWHGVDPDPDLRGFHDAGPGQVTALLGYLLAVRADAAAAAGGLPARARFYRNADLEFSLRLGRSGRLEVPPGQLPVRQARHRGYHDSDPQYRDRESQRNYRRVLEFLRSEPA